jgi:alkylation response protein AidB-like acyl-CoA dehydrogenase
MDFGFSAEQDELRAVVRRMFSAAGEDAVRGWFGVEPGYDTAWWRRLAAEVGVGGLLVPSALGGSGATLVDLGVVIEEAGYHLYSGPVVATAGLAPIAFSIFDDPHLADRYLPGIADGSAIVAVAVPTRSAAGTLATTVTAESNDTGWALTGSVPALAHGVGADVVLVPAATPNGPALFAVDASLAGCRVIGLTPFDLTRPLARAEFSTCPAVLVGVGDPPIAGLQQLVDVAAALLAVEQVGGMQRVLDLSVAHALSRHQFGQPIGTFQAIKHLCADMLLRLETARAAAYYALWAAAELNDELPLAAPLALAYCSDAYCAMTSDCIQIHGGMGFTWDHPAHLYLRRARSTAEALGAPDVQREVLLSRLLDTLPPQ